MEQALKILEAMDCHIRTSEAVASSLMPSYVLFGVIALFGVVALGYGAYYALAGPRCFSSSGLLLMGVGLFCVFVACVLWTSTQKMEPVQQYTVVLDDKELIAASSAGVKLEPYDPATNTYRVLGMRG